MPVFHRPRSTEHQFTEFLNTAQYGQGPVERLPIQQGDIDCPHVHEWICCRCGKLCHQHKHHSQHMEGVDGGLWVLSSPIALPAEKPAVEDHRTRVLQKTDHTVAYHTLQWIHRRSTMMGNSL